MAEHHHDHAHERTGEDGKERNEGGCFDVTQRSEDSSTANTDEDEADAEFW